VSAADVSPPPVAAPPGPVTIAIAAVQQLRPKQWTKNVFLFAALVFSGQFLSPEPAVRALLGFAAFSLLASAGYVFNDYLDRDADRRHPKKRHRPIASGRLPVAAAVVEMAVVLTAGIWLSWQLGPLFLAVGIAYLVTTLSYSFVFKHIVILDVMVLSLGFVWRVIAGAVAIQVKVSPWLFLCTAFMALFLGFNKRRGELRALGDQAGTRKNLVEYSDRLLQEYQSIVTGNTVLCYSLYAVLGPTPWMALTIPFVLYAIFRYVYLVEQKGEGGAPDETLLRDAPILLSSLFYGLVAVGVLVGVQQGWLPDTDLLR
jgi:4-hydroxybenzoate polyprenyltransferase